MNTNDQQLLELYKTGQELARIGNIAVQKAQERNRQLGIPNAYSINGILYFEKPNGELTTENLLEKMMKERGYL